MTVEESCWVCPFGCGCGDEEDEAAGLDGGGLAAAGGGAVAGLAGTGVDDAGGVTVLAAGFASAAFVGADAACTALGCGGSDGRITGGLTANATWGCATAPDWPACDE